jgi:hypothetical protein
VRNLLRPLRFALLAPVLTLVLAACAHDPAPDARPATPPAIDPNAEPLPPQVPTSVRPAMNTEYFLGSEAEEQAQFASFARKIQDIQKQAAREHAQPISRGFHAKSHACLNGRLELFRDRDPRTRFGVFADDAAPKPVIVRFSNGVGWRQADDELDARGIAIKVLGVPGPKYLPDEQGTQDFLMTNSPVPVGRDAVEFMKFAQANTDGRIWGLFFLIGNARTAAPALSRTTPIDSMVTERFWSGGSFHLGAHQAVKLSTRPCDLRLVRQPSRSSEDYLKADLVDAAKGGVCMTLYVQFQSDPEKTPIENASIVWEEADAPLVRVGRIVMPPQTVDPAATPACDQLSFSPWHSLPAHKPMGHTNRARRYVYAASKMQRNGGGEPPLPAVTASTTSTTSPPAP